MFHFIIPALLLFLQLTVNSQPLLSWDRDYSGPISQDRGFDIAVDDSSKNIYVTGRSMGVNTNFDIVTIKYNSDGEEVWSKRYNSPTNLSDEPVSIKLNGTNGVFILGKTVNTSGAIEMLLIKYNTHGELLWNTTFNNNSATGDDIPFDFNFDDFGNIYLGGSSRISGLDQPMLIKFDPMGMRIWNKNYVDSSLEEIVKVDLNHVPNLVILIKNVFLFSFDLYEVSLNDGEILREYNGFYNGNQANNLGSPNDLIADASSGNMWVLGTDVDRNPNDKKVWTIKYVYGNAEPTSARTPPSGIDIEGISIQIDTDKNVYSLIRNDLGIRTTYIIRKNFVTMNPLWAEWYLPPNGLDYFPVSLMVEENVSNPSIYVGGYNSLGNIFIVKHDSSDGDTIWATSYNCENNGPDIASSFLQDKYDNFYITGYSNCNGTGDDVKTIKYCLTVPEVPDTIVGPLVVCASEAVTYSVPRDTTVEYYTWLLPPGWVGEVVGDTIQVIAGESGNLSVIANGRSCSSDPKVISTTVLTIPSSPLEIFGDNEMCSGSNASFYISEVSGATSYTWNLPAGWMGSSNTDTINIQPNLESGNITITADNICGSSPETNLSITVSETPLAPTEIEGDSTVCIGLPQAYEVSTAPGVSYYWSGPPEWGVSSTPSNEVFFIPTISGALTVYAQKGECTSLPYIQNIDVNSAPGIPDTIFGELDLCGNTTIIYTINSVDRATSYLWNNSGGWLGNSDSISISYEVTSSGIITVIAINECGSSDSASIDVILNQDVPAQPSLIIGDTLLCPNSTEIFSIDNQNDATNYLWVSPGWGSSNTNTFEAFIGSQGGTIGAISVYAINECGFSALPQYLNFAVIDTTITLHGSTLSANQLEGVEYQWVSCHDNSPIEGEISQEFTPAQPGSYAVILSINSCSILSECIFITSTEQNGAISTIKIAPNPFSDHFIVDGSVSDIIDINIYNAMGKEINFQIFHSATGIELNLSQYPSGLYILELGYRQSRISYTLIKM